MADGFLRMQEEEFDMFTGGLQKNSDNFTNTNDNYKKTFQSLVNTGLAGNSVGRIGNQMSAITNSINNVNNIIKEHSTQMFNFDKSVAGKANDIDIPNDFLSNDSASVNYYTQTLLDKIDGRSVNEGHETEMANEIDESVVAAESLFDMRGVTSKEEKYDSSSSIVGQTVLGNISGNVTQEKDYDAHSNVVKEALSDIRGEDAKQSTYDAHSNVSKEALSDIRGENAKQSTYDDSSSIAGRTALGNINNGVFNKAPEYEDNTGRLTQASLKNVRQNEETENVSFDELNAAFSSTVAKSLAEEEAERRKHNGDGPNNDGSVNVR